MTYHQGTALSPTASPFQALLQIIQLRKSRHQGKVRSVPSFTNTTLEAIKLLVRKSMLRVMALTLLGGKN